VFTGLLSFVATTLRFVSSKRVRAWAHIARRGVARGVAASVAMVDSEDSFVTDSDFSDGEGSRGSDAGEISGDEGSDDVKRDRYLVLSALGAGATASTFLCLDVERENRPVVVKRVLKNCTRTLPRPEDDEGAHRENKCTTSKSSAFTPRAARGRVGRHTRGVMSSAPPLSTPLALARVSHVAEALLACVDSTFGVAGKDRWIRNARNQVVITNSGDAVLRSVTVTHPVASYLREVITTHAERHGDGSVSTLAMVTAGVARVAELCGRDFGSGDARRKRASLARALSRVADGALRTTLLPLAIDAATVRVPIPGLERLEMSRDASEDDVNERETGENVSRWDVGDRFRAGLRAAAATSLAGAAAPATRAALARLAVTLVANTVDRALRDNSSDRDRLQDDGDDVEFADGDGHAATYKEKKATRKIETRKSKIESVRVALRDLRARPPVWSARGASVEASVLLRGVLLRGRLVRVAEVRRDTRENTDEHVERKSEGKGSEKERSGNAGGGVFAGVDAPARVAALRGVALDDPFFGNEDDSRDGFECAYAGSERNTEENEAADREEVLRSARAFAARTRAEVLASRGVDLVVSSTRVSALVASALADRGVFVIELVSARDFDALLSALRIAPARFGPRFAGAQRTATSGGRWQGGGSEKSSAGSPYKSRFSRTFSRTRRSPRSSRVRRRNRGGARGS
jgi:hypothetical protein